MTAKSVRGDHGPGWPGMIAAGGGVLGEAEPGRREGNRVGTEWRFQGGRGAMRTWIDGGRCSWCDPFRVSRPRGGIGKRKGNG